MKKKHQKTNHMVLNKEEKDTTKRQKVPRGRPSIQSKTGIYQSTICMHI